MKLTSSAFEHMGEIPSQYTCDGENINPPLMISDVPEGAGGLVLIVEDPDVPESAGVSVWDHWVMWNISPTTTEIAAGVAPDGAVGANTRGDMQYTGPCPPDGEHRYFFHLYALDAALDLAPGATKEEVCTLMESHVLGHTTLMGRYTRTV